MADWRYALVNHEFHHACEALRHCLSDGGTRSVTTNDDMWVLAMAFDGHRPRWGGRALDYFTPIFELIPAYALLERTQD